MFAAQKIHAPGALTGRPASVARGSLFLCNWKSRDFHVILPAVSTCGKLQNSWKY
jgi:hypothetical protein